MTRRVDLTGAERDTEFPVLDGLRPLMDMPDWGYTQDAAAPVPEEHLRDLFCEPWETLERPEEQVFPRLINSCGNDTVAFVTAAQRATIETASVPVPCVQGLNGDHIGETVTKALSAVVAAGGTGYAVDDVLTVVGGTSTSAATFVVTGETAGVIDTVALVEPGLYTVEPGNPAATTGGTGNATLTVTYTPVSGTALYLPFKIDLPRDADLCEDMTGQAIAAAARRRILEFAELSVLQQTWSATVEPRSTSLARNAQDISSGAAVGLHTAYGDLVSKMEESDHVGWTLGMPARGKAPAMEKGIVRPVGGGFRDVHNQRVIAGGQAQSWIPGSTLSTGAQAAATGAEGYLVASGPVWFALEAVEEAISREAGLHESELKQSIVSTRPQLRGMVITRTTDIFAVLTDFSA